MTLLRDELRYISVKSYCVCGGRIEKKRSKQQEKKNQNQREQKKKRKRNEGTSPFLLVNERETEKKTKECRALRCGDG